MLETVRLLVPAGTLKENFPSVSVRTPTLGCSVATTLAAITGSRSLLAITTPETVICFC